MNVGILLNDMYFILFSVIFSIGIAAGITTNLLLSLTMKSLLDRFGISNN